MATSERTPGGDMPSRAHRSKPDPDEPWRYVCPKCENQVRRPTQGYVYRCGHCAESFERDELTDLKNE